MTRWTIDEIDRARVLIANNTTYEQVAVLLGRSLSSVQTKMNRLGVESNYLNKSFGGRKRIGHNGVQSKYEKYDWASIQKSYDDQGTFRSIQRKFKLSASAIKWGTTNGKLVFRSKAEAMKVSYEKLGPKTLSDETKAKISASRKRYLDANPDKIPYLLNHSSKVSFPEKIFMDELNRRNITGWCYNLQVGRYAFDIAFEDIKLDVEIDGGSHLQEKVAQKDADRDIFSKSLGWTVLRFTAKDVLRDLNGCVDRMQEVIAGMR